MEGSEQVSPQSVAPTATAGRIVALLMIVAALWWAQALLIPIVLSVFISYALEPAVGRIRSWHVPRLVAVPIILALLLGTIAGAAYLLRGQAVAFVDSLPHAAHRLAETLRRKPSDEPGTVQKLQRAAAELETATRSNEKIPGIVPVPSVRIEEPTFKLNEWIWQGSYGAVGAAGQAVAILCLVYGLLVAGDLYRRKLVRLVGPSMTNKRITVEILQEIDKQIARFIWTRIVISAVVASAIWISFRWLGLDEPAVWAMLAGFLFAIPIVGPALVILGSGIAAFVQFNSLGMAALFVGVTSAIAAIEGNVLTPLMMRRVGEMNVVVVFVSLMFWGWIWGIWGLVLAVPITAAVKSVAERVEGLGGLAELLGQ